MSLSGTSGFIQAGKARALSHSPGMNYVVTGLGLKGPHASLMKSFNTRDVGGKQGNLARAFRPVIIIIYGHLES